MFSAISAGVSSIQAREKWIKHVVKSCEQKAKTEMDVSKDDHHDHPTISLKRSKR